MTPDRAHDGGPRRAAVVVLAVAGALVSAVLAAFQLDLIGQVWDPLFGSDSSADVLKSSFSESLPIPDALLGLGAYAAEAVLEVRMIMGHRGWTQVLLALLVAGLALTAVGLVALQGLVIGSWCTLCLCSAAISLTIAVLAAPDVVEAVRTVRRHRAGCSATPHAG
jgi:uncharacterized membrane protein